MLRGEMKDMSMAGVTQKRPALNTFFELVRLKGNLAPAGHQATDIQTPVGGQVVHDPIVAFHPGQVLVGVIEMGHKIRGLTRGFQRSGNLSGGHGQRVDQDTGAPANVFMFTPFALTWPWGLGGGVALKDLHAGLFIAADYQATLLIG